MKRVWAALPLAVFLGLAVLAGWAMFANRLDKKASPLIGQPAPALTLPGLTPDDPPLDLASLRGRIVVVNFMASWCAPCRVEHPVLVRAASDPRYVLVAVAYKDKPADTLAMMEELGNPFAAIGQDPNGAAGVAFGLTGVPETYVIGADGTVVSKHAGPVEDADVRRILAPALAAAR